MKPVVIFSFLLGFVLADCTPSAPTTGPITVTATEAGADCAVQTAICQSRLIRDDSGLPLCPPCP